MLKTQLNRHEARFKLLSVILSSVFYFGIALIDGPVWCVDTESYVIMNFSREPVYPLFLLGLRRLFDALNITAQPYNLPAYLTLAIILQSLLWILATCYIGFYILNITKNLGEKKSIFLSAIAMLCQIGVAGINRFVANRGSMYSESLMTESLAMPLYVIFMVLLIKSFDEYNRMTLIKLFLLSILVCSIRKQMLIVLITWGFASFIFHIFVPKYRDLKKFAVTFIVIVMAFISINLIDCSYNYAIRGVFTTHTGNSKGGLDTLLYTANVDDDQLFADADKDKFPNAVALFDEIYLQCKELKLTIDYAPGYELQEDSSVFNSDWASMAGHYADSYDVIGFDVVLPILKTYVADNFPELDEVHAAIKQDQVEQFLFKTLLKNTLKNVTNGNDRGAVYVLTANVLKAFVISNANISPEILIKVSLVIYFIYLVVFIALLLKRKTYSANIAARMMLIVMAGIAINSVVTGSMIFPQPRYMCYAMGMFYLALVWGITELLGRRNADR